MRGRESSKGCRAGEEDNITQKKKKSPFIPGWYKIAALE